jgi:hypothetical protein
LHWTDYLACTLVILIPLHPRVLLRFFGIHPYGQKGFHYIRVKMER